MSFSDRIHALWSNTDARAYAVASFLVAALLLSGATHAETLANGLFDGICIDTGECAGIVSIEDDVFPMCEETCRLQNPVAVKGMDAVLYDAECSSDHAGVTKEQMFFSKFGFQSNDGVVGTMVTSSYAYPLVNCSESSDAGLDDPLVAALIKRFFEYADLCRGGGADEPDVEKRILMQEERCAEWSNIEIELNQTHGFCYGTQDQATSEFEWLQCAMNSNYRPFDVAD